MPPKITLKIIALFYFCPVFCTIQTTLENLLNKYQRPVTILEIGHKNLISLESIKNYKETTYVFIHQSNPNGQNQEIEKIVKKCEKEQLNNLIVLQKKLSDNDLLLLGECEHFDIAILPNFIELDQINWQETLKRACKLGEFTIIDIDTQNSQLLENFLEANQIFVVEKKQDLQKTICLLKTPKKTIARRSMVWPPPNRPNFKEDKQHLVESSFTKKKLIKIGYQKKIESNWEPGINLVTFKKLNGIYPSYHVISNSLKKLEEQLFPEWGVHNMVIQGNKIKMIDKKDLHDANESKNFLMSVIKKRIPKALLMIQCQNPDDFYNLFWNIV